MLNTLTFFGGTESDGGTNAVRISVDRRPSIRLLRKDRFWQSYTSPPHLIHFMDWTKLTFQPTGRRNRHDIPPFVHKIIARDRECPQFVHFYRRTQSQKARARTVPSADRRTELYERGRPWQRGKVA